MSPTPEQKKAEVEARVRRALHHIQEAQGQLGLAMAELGGFIGGMPEYTRAGKLYDQVHKLWYRVRDKASRYKLDDMTEAALEKRLAQPKEGP